MSVKVDFMPKFSTRGVWQRWRESYASEGKKVEPNITVFSGVCIVLAISFWNPLIGLRIAL